MRFAVLFLLLALAGTAHADAVRTLERGVALAARAKFDRSLVLKTRRGMISLNADTKTIGLHHAFRQRAFFLQSDGTLSKSDRSELAQLLEHEEGVSAAGAIEGLRSAVRDRKARAAELASANPTIDHLLDAARVGYDYERPLLSRTRSEIRFRKGESGGILVLKEGFRQHGLFLGGDAKTGFTLTPDDRADLAKFLLGPKR